ncbi:hypothetical protein CPT_Paty_001 [Acinetobacter phage Paty]|uniref:Uncharacterized protein n=1 Tax=Acinetobacter phage Paty TaxID=2797426 RepID=A0A7T7K874_9CAUD|nr:hypothetical protein CPT_Paty_001 [Acinetobacter phage Paty]
MSTPFLIYLYRTSLFECTVLERSLGGSVGITYLHLSTTLINVYREVLGSFSERLYWFGSLPLCISLSIHSMHFFLSLHIIVLITILISIFLLLSYIVLIYMFLSVLI